MIEVRSLHLKRCVCTAPETTLFGDPEKRNQNDITHTPNNCGAEIRYLGSLQNVHRIIAGCRYLVVSAEI